VTLRSRLRYGGWRAKATNLRLFVGWKIRQWWDGEYGSGGEDPNTGVQFFRITGSRSKSSDVAHLLADF